MAPTYKQNKDFEDTARFLFNRRTFKQIPYPSSDDDEGHPSDLEYRGLRFEEISTGRRFWVECKYRPDVCGEWKTDYLVDDQFFLYKRIRARTGEPVFLMTGLGGTTWLPEIMYCLNLDEIHFATFHYGSYDCNRVDDVINSLDELIRIAAETDESIWAERYGRLNPSSSGTESLPSALAHNAPPTACPS